MIASMHLVHATMLVSVHSLNHFSHNLG